MAILAVSLSGQSRAQSDSSILSITVEHSLGLAGPLYSVTIFPSGKLLFEGKEGVRVRGKAHARFNKEVFSDLVSRINSAGFFSLEDDYNDSRCATHGGEMAITVRTRLQAKQISAYCVYPEILNVIAETIDRAANARRWIFIDGKTLQNQINEGWNVKNLGPAEMEQAIDWDADDVIAVLARAGMNVNARKQGEEPYLLTAVRAGSYRAAKELIAQGAKLIDPSEHGDLAPCNAGYRTVEMMKLFLDRGVDVNIADRRNETMLMNAAQMNNLDAVRMLIEKGANPNLRNVDGKTALGLLEERRGAFRPQEEIEDVIGRSPDPDKTRASFENALAIYNMLIAYLKERGGVL